MFYRYTKAGARIPVDLDDMYLGRSLFLAGGAPSLVEEPNLNALQAPGHSLMAMNNTASIFSMGGVDFWIGCDKPGCYSARILMDPKIMKFAIIAKRSFALSNGMRLVEVPNILFFGTHGRFTVENFLKKDRDQVWWKNTFFNAIQTAWHLGFRKIYLIGCSFKVGTEKQYSYDFKLDDYQQKYNQRLYNQAVDRMKSLKPCFDKHGLTIISATPDSAINDMFPFMTFDEALEDSLKDFPGEYNISECKHSSEYKKEKVNGKLS